MKAWQPKIIQLLAVIGIVVAFYLKLFHDGVLFLQCEVNSTFDCGKVSGPYAEYSTFFGVPVALIGLIGYVLIFGAIWLVDWVPLVRRYLGHILLLLIGGGFTFTAYLTAIEALVVGAYCQYCLYSAAIITVMLLLTISYWRSSAETT